MSHHPDYSVYNVSSIDTEFCAKCSLDRSGNPKWMFLEVNNVYTYILYWETVVQIPIKNTDLCVCVCKFPWKRCCLVNDHIVQRCCVCMLFSERSGVSMLSFSQRCSSPFSHASALDLEDSKKQCIAYLLHPAERSLNASFVRH